MTPRRWKKMREISLDMDDRAFHCAMSWLGLYALLLTGSVMSSF